MNFLFPLFIVFVKLNCLKGKETSQPPHIIFIFADDLGWNDISLHGSPEIPTPNIDALALNGLILHNYYTWWLCTPSRGSFLTGKYPTRLGLQHSALRAGEASGLPLYEVTLPQRLKKLGYRTHLIGKWHLGYKTKEHTPTYRGFDTFFGYLNGYIDYYDHTIWEDTLIPNVPYFYGLDFHNGTTILKDKQGQYATHLFTEEAENIILNHDTSKPLFLFLSHIAAHTGNGYRPHQAPPEVISKFKYIKNISRRIHAAIISVMDDGVGKVFQALDQKDMLKNSIVMFVSDNGGSRYPGEVHASNYPLRGEKETQWEGGIRVPAAIWSPLLKLDKPRISKQLMHVSDWLPTFYRIAGGDLADLGQIDGYDQLGSPHKRFFFTKETHVAESRPSLRNVSV
ncbi:arylsulfatase B [Caerostris extrusa]|uniref:Arylsulfatase B n=1 Tax=Caerostris extrusa TaxID=172846 RepID=A0AAV4MSY2_CAEEX|nr:arylsulfatase B [Caerostris extrusa]